MKKLEIIIKSEKLEQLKKIMDDNHVTGLNVANIMGFGHQRGYADGNGDGLNFNLLPKIKVETVVADDQAEKVVNAVVSGIHTGKFGDGKIFVYDVVDAVRIRTGAHGDEAI